MVNIALVFGTARTWIMARYTTLATSVFFWLLDALSTKKTTTTLVTVSTLFLNCYVNICIERIWPVGNHALSRNLVYYGNRLCWLRLRLWLYLRLKLKLNPKLVCQHLVMLGQNVPIIPSRAIVCWVLWIHRCSDCVVISDQTLL